VIGAPARRGNSFPPLTSAAMPREHRFESKAIKNKQKREDVFHKTKKEKGQAKLQRRLANAKREADDPKAKQVCMRCDAFEHLSQVPIKLRRNDWRRMFPAHSKTHASLIPRS
jgi:hypothetical protein